MSSVLRMELVGLVKTELEVLDLLILVLEDEDLW